MSAEANQALELDELKALCAAATPGPWSHHGWYRCGVNESYAVWEHTPEESEPVCKTERQRQGWYDAAFIAAARSAVPVLIAEVERLTQERDTARSALDSVRDFAVAVERQNHDALVAAQDALDADGGATFHVLFDALTEIVRLLETENQ